MNWHEVFTDRQFTDVHRIAWIRNTMDIGELAISENLVPRVSDNPEVEIVSEPRQLEFDDAGNLIDVFAAEPVAR